MKKEAIILKVNQKTIDQIEDLNLNLKDVVKEAFLRGVSHLKGNKLALSGNLGVKTLKDQKSQKDK